MMHPLKRLMICNRHRGRFSFDMPKASDSGQVEDATVYLYDTIVEDDATAEFWGGVSPGNFARTLASIKSDTVHLRINSPGGDVFGGRAIAQAIKEFPGHVIAHVDGYAASAASYVAIAADEVMMAEGAYIMIHNAWTLAFGNAEDLMHTATLLEDIDNQLVKTYASATGLDADQIRQMMSAETWINADRAVELGFADSVVGPAPKNDLRWDLSAFTNAPKSEPAAPDSPEIAQFAALHQRARNEFRLAIAA